MQILQPAGWKRPKGYANGVAASGRMLFVAGQVGWDAEPAGKVSLDLGTAWAEGMRSAVLEVPSDRVTGKVSVRVWPSPRLWTTLAGLLRM